MPLFSSLESFLEASASSYGPQPILIAFSGGPDSAALLWALANLRPTKRCSLHAAHLDHRLDPDSTHRAEKALQLAAKIGIPCTSEAIETAPQPGDSIEDFARRHRYRFLERVADQLQSKMILTAHHADDQAETLILRILYGSGLAGLAGIRPRLGRVYRPLLHLRRRQIHQAFKASGLSAVIDPTNQDSRFQRNFVRNHLLPRLESESPGLIPRLGGIADASVAARDRSRQLLSGLLDLSTGRSVGASLRRKRFQELPQSLQDRSLALLAETAGAQYPPAATVRKELRDQLARGGKIGCDSGAGWRIEGDRDMIRMVRLEPITPSFAYTSKAPGAVDVPELALRIRIEPGSVADWMFHSRSNRAGLAIRNQASPRFEIRNRRPGDRIRPLGAEQDRRLKDLLISRRVPKSRRDRLPLLLIDGEIAWVPGVATSEAFRLTDSSTSAWSVTIEPLTAEFSPDDSVAHGSKGRLDRKVAEP